ncbi:MAG: hypothetical protein ABI220_05110 [Candidatus Saccharimonadales bacterium]
MKQINISKPTKNSNHKPSSKKRPLIVILAVLVAVGLVIQVSIDVVLYNHVIRNPAPDQLVSLIIKATEAQTKPAVTDPHTNKIYLPEVGLVLPASTGTFNQLLYGYMPPFDDWGGELNVTTRQAMQGSEVKIISANASNNSWWHGSDQSKIFDHVPELQACARGVAVYFDAKTATESQLKPVSQVHLADGRTLYIGIDSDQYKCHYNMSGLLTYLKQAQSYKITD